MWSSYKETIFLILLCFVGTSIFAQISGYQGRRVIVKTDLPYYLLDKGYNLEVEVAVLRHLSLSASYRTSNRKLKQPVLNSSGTSSSYPDAVEKFGLLLPDKADFTGKEYVFTARAYFRSAFCAPKDPYIFGYIAPGRADIQGDFTVVDTDAFSGQEGYVIKSYDIRNLRTFRQGVGFGMQWIVFSRLTVDVGGALEGINLNRDKFEFELEGVRAAYGPPLFSEARYRVDYGPKAKVNFNGSTWGLMVFAKLGILVI